MGNFRSFLMKMIMNYKRLFDQIVATQCNWIYLESLDMFVACLLSSFHRWQAYANVYYLLLRTN